MNQTVSDGFARLPAAVGVPGASAASVRTRFCILGASLDVGNRGVRALGTSLAQLLERTAPGSEIVFHYGNATGGTRDLADAGQRLRVSVQNCRMSPRSSPQEHIIVILGLALLHRLGFRAPARRNPWLRSLLEADFVGDIRGGDSFSDIYGVRRFLLGSLPLLSVAVLQKPYVMLPQTYGPFTTRTARSVARFLLKRAAIVLTRDRHCEPTVRQLGERTPQFCPDVAFTLEPLAPVYLQVKPDASVLRGGVVVGINISGLLYMGGYSRSNMFGLQSEYRSLIDQVIEQILSATTATILLVPHVFGSEEEEAACAALLTALGARYPGRVFSVEGPLSERELKWVVGRTDFFIGSRMHACIAALSQCVPAVGLAYSDKFLGVFQSAGVAEAIVDLRRADAGDVTRRTLRAFEQRAQLRQQLLERMPGIQHEIRHTFKQITDVPKRP